MPDARILWLAKYRQLWDCTAHCHSYYQLIYPLGGTGIFECGTLHGEFSADGSLFLIPPGVMHSFNNNDCCDTRRHTGFWAFDCKFTLDAPELAARLKELPYQLRPENPHTVRVLCDAMVAESLHRPPFFEKMLDIHILALIVELARLGLPCHTLTDSNDVYTLYSPTHDVQASGLYDLIRYINDSFHLPITLDDLSQRAGLNKTTLIEAFRQVTGVTPMKYVGLCRIDRAKELLSTTDLSVGEISDETGFQSIHYFCKVFREKEGCSPGEYRRQRSGSHFASITPEDVPVGPVIAD